MAAGSMLESMIGSPEDDEDDEDDEDAPSTDMEDPKAKKKRAIKALFAAMKSGDADAGATAFADAVDACLEYGESEE